MKKKILAITVLAACMMFASCGKESDGQGSDTVQIMEDSGQAEPESDAPGAGGQPEAENDSSGGGEHWVVPTRARILGLVRGWSTGRPAGAR